MILFRGYTAGNGSGGGVQDIASVSIGTVNTPLHGGGFRSLYTALSGTPGDGVHGAHATPPSAIEEAVDPVEQARMEAFAQGFDEGCRVTAQSLEGETDACNRLANALELLAPAPSGVLSDMLSAAVIRLVGQIAGEVDIDAALLRQRCDAVAAMIDEGNAQGALHLHPDDLPLIESAELGVRVLADAGLHRGCVRLDTADGWIEDGPEVRLSRLRALLDDMEGRL